MSTMGHEQKYSPVDLKEFLGLPNIREQILSWFGIVEGPVLKALYEHPAKRAVIVPDKYAFGIPDSRLGPQQTLNAKALLLRLKQAHEHSINYVLSTRTSWNSTSDGHLSHHLREIIRMLETIAVFNMGVGYSAIATYFPPTVLSLTGIGLTETVNRDFTAHGQTLAFTGLVIYPNTLAPSYRIQIEPPMLGSRIKTITIPSSQDFK